MNNEVTSWQDTQKLLAFVVVVGFLVVIFLWMFFPPHTSEAQAAALNILIGGLGTMAGTVMTFYFGNSRAAANKDETIKQLSLTPAAPPPPPPPAP